MHILALHQECWISSVAWVSTVYHIITLLTSYVSFNKNILLKYIYLTSVNISVIFILIANDLWYDLKTLNDIDYTIG